MIRFDCLGCGRWLNTSDASAGKSSVCPKCGTQNVVPNRSTPPDHPPARTPDEREPSRVGEFAKSLLLLALLIGGAIGAAGYIIDKVRGEKSPSVATTAGASSPATRGAKDTSPAPVVGTVPAFQSPPVTIPVDVRPVGPNTDDLRKAARRVEIQSEVQRLQFEKNRYVTLRDNLVRDKNQAEQKMMEDTLRFANGAKTNGGAFGRGLLGGFATSVVSNEFDKKIAEANSAITGFDSRISSLQSEANGLR